jgi:hypothetical protein
VQAEVTTLLVVEDGAEDARGIEGGKAQPVYGPILSHERRRVQVPYDPVVRYRKVTQLSPLVFGRSRPYLTG